VWGQWSHSGIEAWRAMAAGWFGTLWTERVRVDVANLQVHGSGDWAAAHAILTYTALSAQGQTLRSLDNRITLVLRKAGYAWLIVHQHTSAPIDHATQKAMLSRVVGVEN
jgi:ketosteroid isomerase-like protein